MSCFHVSRCLPLVIALVVSVADSRAGAQCHIATVAPFDASPSNPVTLATEQTGTFMVPGLQTHFVARSAGSLFPSHLLLGCRRIVTPFAIPPHAGALLLDPTCVLPAIQSNSVPPRWVVPIPNNTALLDGMVFAQSAHLATPAGPFRLSNGLEFRIGFIHADIGVVRVVPPSGPIGGSGAGRYPVTLRNHGNLSVMVPVTVTVGPNFGTATLGPVDPGRDFTGDVFVPTPFTNFSCGGSTPFPVLASSNLPDCNPANNQAGATVSVRSAYWDLHLDVVSSPTSICRGSSTSWTIRVTNRGNVSSPNVCAFSGINCGSGAGSWNCNLGLNHFTTPQLGPGQSWTYQVTNYFVPCNALLQTQYIKVEINYSAGCFDNCAAGNYDQQAVQIVWCGC